jgi:hypothetical protein
LFSLRGTDPVMATVMMQGWGPRLCIRYVYPEPGLGIWDSGSATRSGLES